MTIRIKNKYLVLIGICLLLSMGFVKIAGGDILFYRAESAWQAGDYAKALALFDAFLERFPKHVKVPEALYWSAEILPGLDVFEASFFPGGSSVSRRTGEIPKAAKGALTKEERYLKIRSSFPRHWAANHVDYRLAELYWEKGDPRAEKFYLLALYSDRGSRRIDAGLRLMEIYISESRFVEALEIARYCQNNLANHLAADVQLKLGDIYAAEGNIEKAKEAYNKVRPIVDAQLWDDTQAQEGTLNYYEEKVADRLKRLAAAEEGGFTSVEGMVTHLGRPLPGINVFANPITGTSRSYSSREVAYRWITNQNGFFKGELPPGSYEFGIRMNQEQAYGVEGSHLQIVNGEQAIGLGEVKPIEFRFVATVTLNNPLPDTVYGETPLKISWDAFPGASHYGIQVYGLLFDELGGRSSSVGITRYTKETSYHFDEDNILPFGVYGRDQDGVHPVYFLTRTEEYDGLRFVVQALDDRGRILSSTGGISFSDATSPGEIVIKGKADEFKKHIVAREYDQAVEWLQERVVQDPTDVDALWKLAKVYFYGTYHSGDDWENVAHRDRAESLRILKKIRALEPGQSVLNAIIIVKESLGHDTGLLEIHQELVERGEGADHNYNYLAHHALEHDSDLEAALELYDLAIDADFYQYYGFFPYYGLKIIMGRIDEALQIAKRSGISFESRLNPLLEGTRKLRDSGRYEADEGQYLRLGGPSYTEVLASWQNSEDIYGQFLALAARIFKPKYNRAELKRDLDAFIAKYHSTEQALTDYLQVLMDYEHL